jgi:hypothetical protein
MIEGFEVSWVQRFKDSEAIFREPDHFSIWKKHAFLNRRPFDEDPERSYDRCCNSRPWG